MGREGERVIPELALVAEPKVADAAVAGVYVSKRRKEKKEGMRQGKGVKRRSDKKRSGDG